jgi:hypothetical protein
MVPITAPLQLLSQSPQLADIKASKAPSDIYGDVARVKTYVKDWNAWGTPRDLDFDQPFQWASDHTGLSWAECNRVFMVQTAGCNLSCDYCYNAPCPTVDTTANEVWELYEAQPEAEAAPILRISGGEPLLHQAWVEDVFSYNYTDELVWLDTNLTITPEQSLLDCFYGAEHHAVCGCFKPGQCDIADQLDVVRVWAGSEANLFLYWPSWPPPGEDANDALFIETLEALHGIHPSLPLRLNVIKIKFGYSVLERPRGITEYDENLNHQCFREWHMDWLLEHHSADVVAQPSHLNRLA